MPPPMIRGMDMRLFTAAIIAGSTGLSAPEPASKYTSLRPSISAAMAYPMAFSQSSLPMRSACPTSPTFIPGSTIRYPMGMASIPSFFTTGAAYACIPVMSNGFLLFIMVMNRRASTAGESSFGPPGKCMTGSPEAFLMASAVEVMLSPVTPVDPPMRTASVPASLILAAICPATSGVCLSGSMRAIWRVPLAILSRRSW